MCSENMWPLFNIWDPLIEHISIIPSFLLLSSSSLHAFFFNHSLVDGHLDCSYFLAILCASFCVEDRCILTVPYKLPVKEMSEEWRWTVCAVVMKKWLTHLAEAKSIVEAWEIQRQGKQQHSLSAYTKEKYISPKCCT